MNRWRIVQTQHTRRGPVFRLERRVLFLFWFRHGEFETVELAEEHAKRLEAPERVVKGFNPPR
jgi:hypothetical protein